MIPKFNLHTIKRHNFLSTKDDKTKNNFTLEILLAFSFDGTKEEAKEKLEDDLSSFEKIITEGFTGSGLEYAVKGGEAHQNQELSTVLGSIFLPGFIKRYNFTLEILLSFSFDGTEKEAKEKLEEDLSSFEKIITEGFTGSGLEYAVKGGETHKHHRVSE